jgi:hypothetical protein
MRPVEISFAENYTVAASKRAVQTYTTDDPSLVDHKCLYLKEVGKTGSYVTH